MRDPPWQKHESDNKGIFPLNEDERNWQRSLSAVLFSYLQCIC